MSMTMDSVLKPWAERLRQRSRKECVRVYRTVRAGGPDSTVTLVADSGPLAAGDQHGPLDHTDRQQLGQGH
jgi:hypothetical protein